MLWMRTTGSCGRKISIHRLVGAKMVCSPKKVERDAAQKLMTHHPELTAILTGNDKMALGAMHYLNTVGKKVPHDVSVVGFDDMHQAAFANPALTTVHLPLYETGVLACEKLVARIQGNTDPVRTVLSTHLVVRNSTGMAPNQQ